MEQKIVEMIVFMTVEQQEAFYTTLANQGLTDDEIQVIRNVVFYHKLFTNQNFYQKVRNFVGDQIIAELKAE